MKNNDLQESKNRQPEGRLDSTRYVFKDKRAAVKATD